MSHLMKLKPRGLPKHFDLESHGDKPLVAFDFKENTIKISYIFPGYRISHDPQAADDHEDQGATIYKHEVGIAGTGFFSESGKPLLPSFGRFVQIPPGCNYTYKCKKSGLVIVDDVQLKPAQENVTDQEAWVVEFDQDAYVQDKFYPEKALECHGPLYMDGYRVICIHVRPMQYNPKRHQLHCYSNINVLITLSPEEISDDRDVDKEKLAKYVFFDQSKNLEGFGNFLFNPGRKLFQQTSFAQPFSAPPIIKHRAAEFLIIYGNYLKEPAQKLKDWKQKRGLETELVPVKKIVKPGDDNITRISKIKEYIRGKRGEPFSPLRYVLLLGDVEKIPTEKVKQSDRDITDTDHYFYTHRDARSASDCILPWISGGRIAAATKAAAMSIVDQIISYEKHPPDDPEYYRRMTVAAFFEDNYEGQQDGRADKAYLKTMEGIREHMIARGYKVNRVYVSNTQTPSQFSDGSPVPEKIKDAMIYKAEEEIATKMLVGYVNEGQLIVGHRDHGKKWGWSHPPFQQKHLKDISSNNPSIVFSINCLTGSFERDSCFAEDILALNGGAPSLIAATEWSGAWRNDSMMRALFDSIWPGILHTFPFSTTRYSVKYFRLGDILNYAKAYLLVAHGFNRNTQRHFEIYHVIGDPTLHVWGEEPVNLRLRTSILRDVLLINMNTCPRDAVLSVWYDGERMMRLEPSSTRLAIPMMSFNKLPGDALDPKREHSYSICVCFSAPGHRYAESTLWF